MSGACAAPRILIVKLSAVGDVVHALPALNALRRAYPKAHLAWVAHPGPANLLEGHPQLDELFVLARHWRRRGASPGMSHCLGQIRASRWDWAIDFQGLTKSGAVAWLSRARQRIGFGNQWSRELNRLFVNVRVSPAATPVIQMNMGLLEPLGIDPAEPAEALLHFTPDDEQKARGWAERENPGQEKFLIIDPFAGWPSKLWAHENWARLAALCQERFGLRPLVFYGPGEQDKAAALAGRIGQSGCRAALAPPTTLREYVALARLYGAAMAAADTGPMHIAAALGIPTVALFGPSDSRRNAPSFSNARWRTLQDFSQPCAGTFSRNCPHHPPEGCMATLTPEAVVEALAQLLETESRA